LEVTTYCEWLSKQLRRDFRLPTEAEWEYAAKAGTTSAFSTGPNLQLNQANYLYSEAGHCEGIGRPSAPGSFETNPWGLYDMHGNVNEWCLDPWQPQHSQTQLSAAQLKQDHSSFRVVKGGTWDYPPRLLRSSWRDFYQVEQRLDNLGFRIITPSL
jgi:formylglycine-generating enzyme required for sulfatase activity